MTIPSEKNMYTFGKIVAVAEEHGKIPVSVFDALVRRPVYGLGLLNGKDCWRQTVTDTTVEEELRMLFGKLPGDIEDPQGGVSEAGQCAFWLGYYHRKNLRDEEGRFTPPMLNEAGNLLFGEHWQKPMAQALGLSDTARIRGWLKGSKVPVGIWSELDGMLRESKSRISALLNASESVAAQDDDANLPNGDSHAENPANAG